MKKIVFALISIVLMSSCSDNRMARKYGGVEKIELGTNQRLVNITWKGDELWVLTKENSQTPPSIYQFKEKSSWGILQGTVLVIEK